MLSRGYKKVETPQPLFPWGDPTFSEWTSNIINLSFQDIHVLLGHGMVVNIPERIMTHTKIKVQIMCIRQLISMATVVKFPQIQS